MVSTDIAGPPRPSAPVHLSRTGAAVVVIAASLSVWLLLLGSHDYPSLHIILDTAIVLLALILSFSLAQSAGQQDPPLAAWLSISFANVAVLAVMHVGVSADWFGVLAPIGESAVRWRPASWPPAVHVLPVGVALAISPWCRRGRSRLFGIGLVLLSALLIALFASIPRYSEPHLLGITRPSLILSPLLWVAVGAWCWKLRDRNRLLAPLVVMSAILTLANIVMLYSRAPNDGTAMVAHIGRVAGFLTLLTSQMQLASSDLSARLVAEQELAVLNRELERRVKDRTIQLEETGRQLHAEGAIRLAAEERFRAVVEHASSGMVMIDSRGRINLVNREILRMFGYSREELLGSMIERLVPERLRQGHGGFRERFLLQPQARNMGAGRELYGLRKDGAEFPVEIGLNPIESPEGTMVLASVVDITARKLAELELLRTNERLQRAQTRFEAVVESASSGMVMIDAAGHITLVNREAERLFDYPREELLGRSIEQLVPQRMRGGHGAFRQDFMRDPKARTMGAGRDLYGVRRNGQEFPLEIGLNPIETADGVYVLASVVDISERKAAEASLLQSNVALQRAQARFEVVVESAPSGMVMIDGSGRINLVNREVERLFGYGRDQLLGRPIEDLIPPRFRGGHTSFRDSFMRDPNARAMGVGRDLFGIRQDGVEFPVEIGLNPIETAEGTFVLASVVDISARKAAEAELYRSNEELRQAQQEAVRQNAVLLEANRQALFNNARLRIAVNHLPLTLYQTDLDLRYTWIISPPDALSSAQIVGLTDEDIVPPEAARQSMDLKRRVLDSGEGVREELALHMNGGRTVFDLIIEPLKDDSGRMIGLTGAAFDITARKQVEDELRRSNEELERFAYVASHDLQEPLRMVGSYVQLLAKRYRGKLDQDADDFIGFAVDGAMRMQGLIEDLLAFSRVGSRGGALVPVNMARVAESVLRDLQGRIEESSALVTLDPLPTVQADETQLNQLLLNLISNALKFRGEAAPRIHVAARPNGALWEIAVTDNGIGIEPQYFERIFVLFQRLHTREHYTGTGIGLAIARKIVERHGGRIWVASVPGEGTTFHFTLRTAEPIE